jgi:hypothetical protein
VSCVFALHDLRSCEADRAWIDDQKHRAGHGKSATRGWCPRIFASSKTLHRLPMQLAVGEVGCLHVHEHMLHTTHTYATRLHSHVRGGLLVNTGRLVHIYRYEFELGSIATRERAKHRGILSNVLKVDIGQRKSGKGFLISATQVLRSSDYRTPSAPPPISFYKEEHIPSAVSSVRCILQVSA